jgi:predicted DsbA family dithiol-disulfide isomerase
VTLEQGFVAVDARVRDRSYRFVDTHLETREPTGVQAEQAIERTTAAAAAEGLDYRLDRALPSNTFDAHRLVHLAAAHGRQDAMKERLMRAYLTEGEPIGDPATLERLAIDAGLPADEVRELLAGDRFADEVREDERTAAQFGIHAVPFFVVDRAIGASGAQPSEVFSELLRRGWEARSSAIPVVAGGEACGPEGC